MSKTLKEVWLASVAISALGLLIGSFFLAFKGQYDHAIYMLLVVIFYQQIKAELK